LSTAILATEASDAVIFGLYDATNTVVRLDDTKTHGTFESTATSVSQRIYTPPNYVVEFTVRTVEMARVRL
jgi:hypothetical protein